MCVLRNIFLIILIYNCKYSSTQDVLSFINSKKSINVIDDRFISIVLDPMILLNGINTRLQSLGIAKHLSPAYVRLSSSFDDAGSGNVNKADKLLKLTASQSIWSPLNRWLITANFTPVVKLSDQERIDNAWDPKHALVLMEQVDKINISVVWEMDNMLPHKTLEQYSSDAATLRHVLSAFPASRKSWRVAGGELSRCVLPESNSEAETLHETQKYLKIVEDNVDAISWTPNTHGVIFPAKVIKTAPATHNPAIWTTAPRTLNPTTFKDALIWAKYLGQAANYGYNVIFRQPKMSELQMITPSFWVSIFHKIFVGNEVLDIHNMNVKNKTKCYVFAHSSKNVTNTDTTESITMFVVNLENTESNISATFFERNIIDNKFESYILTTDNENSTKIRLNGDLLTISDLQDQKIKFKPKICLAKSSNSLYLNLPAKSIGFFLIPVRVSPQRQENETYSPELGPDTSTTANAEKIINRLTLERRRESGDSDNEMNKSNNGAERDESASAKLIIKKSSALEQEQRRIDLKKSVTGPSTSETELNSKESLLKVSGMQNNDRGKQNAREVNSLESSSIEDTPVRKTRSVHQISKDYINNKHKRNSELRPTNKHKNPRTEEHIKTDHKKIKNHRSSRIRPARPLKEMDDKSSKDTKQKENQPTSRIKRKLPADVTNENLQQTRIKRQSEKTNNELQISNPELSDLFSDEIKLEIIRQQLEHKKQVEDHLKNYRKTVEEEINREIRSAKNKISSDSEDKTSDDNRTSKFRKLDKRSIDEDKTKEMDAYLNEISREEEEFFPVIQEDIYLIKPQNYEMTNVENKIPKEQNEIQTESNISKEENENKAEKNEESYTSKEEIEMETEKIKENRILKEETESSSSSEEYYEIEDSSTSSSQEPEKEGLVDNVFNTMFSFLRDFHKKIVDYLHYLSR